MFAIRDIPADTELTFDYKFEIYGYAFFLLLSFLILRQKAQPCYCGEDCCSGFIGGDGKTRDVEELLSSDDEGEDSCNYCLCAQSLTFATADAESSTSDEKPKKRKSSKSEEDGYDIKKKEIKGLESELEVLMLMQKLRLYSHRPKKIRGLLTRLLVGFRSRLTSNRKRRMHPLYGPLFKSAVF